MKKLIFLFFILCSLTALAQEPIYTPMKGNYKFKGIKVDSLFLVPSFTDTTAANATYIDQVPGAMIRCGNDFWMRNASADSWLQNVNIGNGVSPVLSFVNEVFKKAATDSVFYIVAPHDTFFAFKDMGVDTLSLSSRINTKIDSLKRTSDSVLFKKNGDWYFAYKDSINAKDTPTLTMVLSKGKNGQTPDNLFIGNQSGTGQSGSNNTYIGNNSGSNHTGSRNNFLGFYSGYQSYCTDANILGHNAGTYNLYSYINLFGNNATADENNQVVFSKNSYPNNKNARISYNNLTSDRKYYLPDSSGTLALKSDITSGQNYIDTIYRKSGKDSIFWKKNNIEYRIKDSTGGGGGADSPDRIDGTATGDVNANMDANAITFYNSKKFKISDGLAVSGELFIDMDSISIGKYPRIQVSNNNKIKFKDYNNTFLEIDTIGNVLLGNKERDSLYMKIEKGAENFYFKSKEANTWEDWKSNKSQIQTSFARYDIDISSANDSIYVPGVYIIVAADNAYKLILPDAADWVGQSITLLSQTGGANTNLESVSPISDRNGSSVSYIANKDFITLYSSKSKWLCYYSQ